MQKINVTNVMSTLRFTAPIIICSNIVRNGKYMWPVPRRLIRLLFAPLVGITLGHYEEGAIHSLGVVIAGIDLG